MTLQQFSPWLIAVVVAILWRKKLVGPQSSWRAYPLALLTALVIASVAGLVKFWIPQIELGFGTKGLPAIVFLIVAYRAALPVALCTVIVLIILGVVKSLRK